MSTPAIIYDGNLHNIVQDGPGWFTLPFQSRGDTQSWEWHCYYTQLASDYYGVKNVQQPVAGIPLGIQTTIEQMQSINTARGTGYLVEESEPQELNNTAWLRFRRTYASIPVNRFEGTTVSYARQFLSINPEYTWVNPPPEPTVNEWVVPLQGYYTFEYAVGQYLPILYAPRISVMFQKILYIPNQASWPPDYTKPFVAQDSERGIYKGGITYRKTLYAQWPS